MKSPRWILGLLVLSMLLPGCGKQMPDEYKQLDKETRQLRMYANTFAWNEMNFYYLWKAEVASAMEKWQNWEEPIAKVAAIRYKDARGEDIDRWTMLTDDFSSFTGSVSGHTRTLGLDYRLYYYDEARTRVCAVVTFAYDGSPAAEAGIGRGAVILKVDGREMTPDNYRELVRNGLLGGGTVTLGFSDGRSVTLTAVDMYENPVHTVRILEREDGRKVGYLHYASFTLDSCQDLVDAFKRFTDEGIDELVLDLRYNGGGYVLAETVLASMLAPVAAVEGKRVFSREVFNETLTEEVGKDSTCFGTGKIHAVLYSHRTKLRPLHIHASDGLDGKNFRLVKGPFIHIGVLRLLHSRGRCLLRRALLRSRVFDRLHISFSSRLNCFGGFSRSG